MKKIAVIDLGTNGFRLYIAEVLAVGKYQITHRQTAELKLASEGIAHIGDAPFARGLATMQAFAKTLQTYDCQQVKAFGTAALRLADNGVAFIETVKMQTGIPIELISGDREADLIYKGMRLNVPLSIEPVLMVDVGGGSVEFIIGNATEVFYAKSFNVGVAILKANFHQNDPISAAEIAAVEQFLNDSCANLKQNVFKFQPKTPVIACGTLDFMVKMMLESSDLLRGQQAWSSFDFSRKQFSAFYEKFISTPTQTLALQPDIPTDKIEMLAVSMVLMDWTMRLLNADTLTASANSMKAGVLFEMSL